MFRMGLNIFTLHDTLSTILHITPFSYATMSNLMCVWGSVSKKIFPIEFFFGYILSCNLLLFNRCFNSNPFSFNFFTDVKKSLITNSISSVCIYTIGLFPFIFSYFFSIDLGENKWRRHVLSLLSWPWSHRAELFNLFIF